MPGAEGARIVGAGPASGWCLHPCTGPASSLLFASAPQPRAAMDVSQPLLLPIMSRVYRAEDELPGMLHPPTQSETCSGYRLAIPLKHPLRQQNIDVSTQNAFSSVPH